MAPDSTCTQSVLLQVAVVFPGSLHPDVAERLQIPDDRRLCGNTQSVPISHRSIVVVVVAAAVVIVGYTEYVDFG